MSGSSVRRHAVTLLDAFCLANGIETGRLAAAAGLSRQRIGRLRYTGSDLLIGNAVKIARGASYSVGRKVPVGELFDLEFVYP